MSSSSPESVSRSPKYGSLQANKEALKRRLQWLMSAEKFNIPELKLPETAVSLKEKVHLLPQKKDNET